MPGAGEAETGSECLVGTAASFGVVRVTQDRTEVTAAQHCEGTKCHRSAHFKMVNFVVFHLDKNNCSDSKCGRHSK